MASGYQVQVSGGESGAGRVFDSADQKMIPLENGVELYEVRDSKAVRVYCRSDQRIK